MNAAVLINREPNIWLPSQGRYLSRLKLVTLRNFSHHLFADRRHTSIDQDRATAILRKIWQLSNLGREPGASHAYRHLLALRLLGLIEPYGDREGYSLTTVGARLLDVGCPGDSLNRDEQNIIAAAFFVPPPALPSPLRAFAALFCPDARDPQVFRDLGYPVELKRHSLAKLEAATNDEPIFITGEDAVDHVISGCRELFLEVGLLGETLPDRSIRIWQRTMFPVRQIEEAHMGAAISQVVAHLRQVLTRTTRIQIPALGAELRPLMKLSRTDFEEILLRISRQNAGEFYFDRLSSILIAGRENAYVRIGDYWRSTIIRC